MALAAATADTWGISGPVFLLAYLVIAASVAVAGTRARRALADPTATSPVGDLTARPHDVAFLNGGGDLAVYSALSAMHLRGTIATEHGTVQAVGRLEPDTNELERAIHHTAANLLPRRRLAFHGPVLAALSAIEKRLVADGLLLSDEQRRRIRQVGTWMLAVAGLGLVRLLAGIADAKPVGFLVAALAVVAVVAAVQLTRAPQRTRLGDRTLADLRTEHHGLSPDVKPDWGVYGPTGAALGVGLFGMGALWASDPAFADEIEAQRITTGGSGDGGSLGFYGGGDSGSSGGHGGGGHSGSSCGSGGGCGGGGGGCGG